VLRQLMAVSILFLHKGFGTDGYHGKVSVQIGNGLLKIANASVANGSSRLRMDRSVLGTHRSRLRMDRSVWARIGPDCVWMEPDCAWIGPVCAL
jgi:hypothetical protein